MQSVLRVFETLNEISKRRDPYTKLTEMRQEADAWTGALEGLCRLLAVPKSLIRTPEQVVLADMIRQTW